MDRRHAGDRAGRAYGPTIAIEMYGDVLGDQGLS
jgi:hypothetical protein